MNQINQETPTKNIEGTQEIHKETTNLVYGHIISLQLYQFEEYKLCANGFINP